MQRRRIAHVDMDAFYASVEIHDNPALTGLPVVVGGPSDARGVVSAASYEARRFGIHSAMPMAEAVRRCPALVRMPVRMDRYAEVSRRVMTILGHYSPRIEPLSLDEAFVDLTGSERSLGDSETIGRAVKHEIRESTGLTASVGVAPVKFVAKIASDLEKPDGLVIVPPGEVTRFLDPLPIHRLWGVGRRTREELAGLGITTIGELARTERRRLEQRFGLHGTRLHDLAHGLDDRDVEVAHDAKSYSHEVTYATDQHDEELLRSTILDQASRVARRLRGDGVRGRTITLKLRDARFRTVTRRHTIATATDDAGVIHRVALELLRETWDGRPVRLVGTGVSGVVAADTETLPLFGENTEGEKRRRLDDTIDRIQDRFGREKMFRAGTMRGRDAPDTGSSLSDKS